MNNFDRRTIESFGEEWSKFDQSVVRDEESKKSFLEYFAIFPWDKLPLNAEGFDMGCGSGRWARYVSERVGLLHCIDPSKAILIAKKNLINFPNICFHQAYVDSQVLSDDSQDFGYSIGVLHHIPDTEAAIRSCVRLLKPGAPFLIYLYYAFDNRPKWYWVIWKISDYCRKVISKTPWKLKCCLTDIFAATIYWPLARFCRLFELLKIDVSAIPLSYYRNHSFYTMRTDSRDRFGTPLENRFSREQIKSMMLAAGLREVEFSDHAPFWCAVGVKL